MPDQTQIDRAEALAALPSLFAVLRRLVISSFEPGDPESDELRGLLDACVVGAHRLKLREELRSGARCVPG
jgi:hypothetical protein